jgi:hypothetical protein
MSEEMKLKRRAFVSCVASLWPLAALRPQAARAAAAARKVTVSCPTATLEEFRRLTDLCVELGVTHVDITDDLPRSRWQWELDLNDPYANWSMGRAMLFKIAVPEALRAWIPADYARRATDIITRRGEILRKLGLKASYSGAEPMWLPDGVYAAHPDWRGPRVQYVARARRDYWAPCVDRPEVLAMYRKAVADVCRMAPFEEFTFLTNDSGAGICWHPHLAYYAGINGPEWCKDRPLADRIQGFMAALQAGARDAGLEADIRIAGQTQAAGKERPARGAGVARNLFPVIGIPQPFAFAEQLEDVFADPEADWRFSIPSGVGGGGWGVAGAVVSASASFDLVREFRKQPAKGAVARIQTLSTVAAHEVGPEAGPFLLRTWECIGRAVDSIKQLANGGPILVLGSVHQRWLVRPLVPYPLQLKPEEKDYYRKFQFQARTEEHAANLMDCQSTYIIYGPAGTWLAGRLFEDAILNLEAAREALKGAMANAAGTARDNLTALDLRLQALVFVIQNAIYTSRYQEFLDRFLPGAISQPDRLHLAYGGLQYAVPAEGIKIVEADIENTRKFIELLKSSSVPIISTAPTRQEEDVFTYGPDLIDQLQRKIDISYRHLPDHLKLL